MIPENEGSSRKKDKVSEPVECDASKCEIHTLLGHGRDEYDVNPHIPRYISKAPWYVDVGHSGLQHQKKQTKQKDESWYHRGRVLKPVNRYRKGACENCGVLTHRTKDCVERPRRIGARWTGKNIRGDEVVEEVHVGFEGKRDRWNGYDGSEYEGKVSKLESRLSVGKYLESETIKETDNYGATSTSLRLREDTAKYLRDLDQESAHYDPKTRSMRENPLDTENKYSFQ